MRYKKARWGWASCRGLILLYERGICYTIPYWGHNFRILSNKAPYELLNDVDVVRNEGGNSGEACIFMRIFAEVGEEDDFVCSVCGQVVEPSGRMC